MAAQAIVNNNERELLRRIWLEAEKTPTAFVSLDTEYTPKGVCELGLAIRTKHNPITARHFIVNKTRQLKRRQPKPFAFGSSEEVEHEGDLLALLDDTLAHLQSENHVVVLAGHEVQVELHNLRKCCGWEVPSQVVVLDTLHIWRSWINVPAWGSLEQALEFFDLLGNNKGQLHNAGNDAKYTMELLVRKAEQVVACPVPMDRTDYEVADGKVAKRAGASKWHSRDPAAPGLAKNPGKKRKRDSGPASELSRGAPSPETLFEEEISPQSRHKRKKRRCTATRPATTVRDTGRGARGREVPPDDADIIDLTSETGAEQEAAVSGDTLIDLTNDTPPPESAEQSGLLLQHG